MFGLWARQLVTFLVIISRAKAQVTSDREYNLTLRNDDKTPDEVGKSKNSSDKQYLVEYSDYMEVPSFKKHQTGHFDYYNFVPDFDLQNVSNGKILINKCCSWNYYFDVDTLQCVKYEENFKNITELKFFHNESNRIFIKSTPRCGNASVLSLEIVSKVGIDSHGITINGSRVFSEYCIDESPKHPNETVVLTCSDPEIKCKSHACFRKCCPLGESFSSGRKCNKTSNPFEPEFYNLTTLTPDYSAKILQYGIYIGDACGLEGKYLLKKYLGETTYLGVDGRLYVPMFDKMYSTDEFCVEYVKYGNNNWIGSFLCFAKSSANFENSQLQFVLLSMGLIISCMFLFLTFLAYLFMPKSQNLYGKTLMCYIVSLFCAYLGLAVVELRSKQLSKTVCTNMGYFILFSFLAAFFWLNVMSFDIWKTFRLDRSVDRSKTDKRRLQFFKYSLYAWAFPSIITAACAVANQMPNFPYEAIKPTIGVENCWFSKERKAVYVFFIGPISLIIACNIIFFIQTAWKIWKVKSDVHKMEKQKTKRFSANKDQFIINGKLFIVMGITWSLEVISFFAPHPIWYITDAANALHGVFIFAVFVLKKKVIKQISQTLRLPRNAKKGLPVESSDESSTKKKVEPLSAKRKTYTTTTPLSISESKN